MTVDVDPGPADLDTADVVLVTIPASTRFLRIARMTAAALAADLGFGIDDIEDLRIAVDESCVAVIGGGTAGATLELRYLPATNGRSVTVEGTCVAPAGSLVPPAITVHPVAAELLDVTTTSHAFWTHEAGLSFRFDKVVRDVGDGA